MVAFPSTVEARGLLEAGRDEEALALAAAAADIGRTHGDANLEVLGRLTVGQVLLQEGRREEALACLDEVMLTVSTGDLYPTVAGLAYCAVIGICMGLLDVPRAQEWTSVLSDWCDAQTGLVPFRGSCLVHRSQIKTMRGDWAGALEEARRACDVPSAAAGDAWYQLGEIHRMHGAYPEAEDAYRQANSLGRQPEPGLALMRLAQGRVDEAVTTFRRLHAEPDRLDRADVLTGYVETMLATGEVDTAEAAVDELESGSEHLPLMYRARAAEARAAVLLARDDGAGGLACLRPAWKAWHALGMPYDEARVRVRMGDACRLLGDDSSAALEYDAAREAFSRLGARPDLERLDRAADPAGRGTDGTRGRGAAAGGGREHQPRDRPGARAQREDGRPAPVEHLHQARDRVAGRRHRVRLRPPSGLTRALHRTTHVARHGMGSSPDAARRRSFLRSSSRPKEAP